MLFLYFCGGGDVLFWRGYFYFDCVFFNNSIFVFLQRYFCGGIVLVMWWDFGLQ